MVESYIPYVDRSSRPRSCRWNPLTRASTHTVRCRHVLYVNSVDRFFPPPPFHAPRCREPACAFVFLSERLLGLLALAFRSHQFYFSHAHDVTQTLQSLRVSASSPSSDVPANSTQPSATTAAAVEQTTGSKNKKHRGHRRWRGRSVSKGGRASAAETAKLARPPPDPRFFWNLGVVGPLLELRERLGGEVGDDGAKGGGTAPSADAVVGGEEGAVAVAAVDRWLTPVMSGFLQVEQGCRVGERGFDMLFVSRRSRLRQGTRFTRRGIDDSGNVANFVETEQVKK